MTHFVATIEKMSVEELARLFRDHIWKLYGLPESIVSDERTAVCHRNDKGVE